MTIGKRDLRRIRLEAKRQLNGVNAQSIRLEWTTRSGGSSVSRLGITTGGTETDNVTDTRAIITHIGREQTEILEKELLVKRPALVQVDTDINLVNSPNFLIVQKIDTETWSGSGTGASSTWTPDSDPSWTADEWIGYWLWLDDRRFKITDNSTNSLTVDLNGGTLQDASAEIVAVQEWYPVDNNPDLVDQLQHSYGSGLLFQDILCTQIPMQGGD